MKKIISLFFAVSVILSGFIFPTTASSEDNSDEVAYVSSSIILYSRSSGFVDGQETTVGLEVIKLINGAFYLTVDEVSAVSEYIDIPYSLSQVEAYRITEEVSDVAISSMNAYYDLFYDNAQYLRSATGFYNCHSYAWYSTGSNNTYWIPFPDNFYENNPSYEKVETPAAGDIICYYNESVNIHSGIVTMVNGQTPNGTCEDANTVEVISKWGAAGLYAHNGADCPYVGTATSVEYYRYHSHAFTYLRNITNPSIHTATCSICDYSFIENHTYQSLPDGSSCCTKCGYTSNGQIIMSEKPEEVFE